MQLLVLIAAFLLLGGKNAPPVSADEMREIIKYMSKDSDAAEIFDEAEKISNVLGIVGPLVSAVQTTSRPQTDNKNEYRTDNREGYHPAAEENPAAANAGFSNGAEAVQTATVKDKEGGEIPEEINFVLKPISGIADRSIYNALAYAMFNVPPARQVTKSGKE